MLLLQSCDYQGMMDKFIPKEESEIAKSYLSYLASGEYTKLEENIAPQLKDEKLRENLEKVASFFPSNKPDEILTVGSNINIINDVWHAQLTYQYKFKNKYVLASITLQKANDKLIINGINVKPLQQSLEEANKFTFTDKNITHYLFFIVTIAMPILSLYALYLCYKTPIPKKKWLWMLFIAVGFMQISFNWSTDQVYINPLSIQLLSAGFFKSGLYGPLILSFSIPVGAAIFMRKRKKWLEPAVTEQG